MIWMPLAIKNDFFSQLVKVHRTRFAGDKISDLLEGFCGEARADGLQMRQTESGDGLVPGILL